MYLFHEIIFKKRLEKGESNNSWGPYVDLKFILTLSKKKM